MNGQCVVGWGTKMVGQGNKTMRQDGTGWESNEAMKQTKPENYHKTNRVFHVGKQITCLTLI